MAYAESADGLPLNPTARNTLVVNTIVSMASVIKVAQVDETEDEIWTNLSIV